MMSSSSVSAGVLAALALASTAHAVDPLQFTTDIRRCVASYAGNGNGSTWQDRPDAFHPYLGGADIEVTNGLETWFSNSTQDSTMDEHTMVFSGTGDGTAVAAPLSAPLTSQGQSKFDLYFQVTEATDYVLTGTVSESGHPDSVAVVRLSMLGGPVIEEVQSTTNSSSPFSLSGTLKPGNYRLYAEATGRGRTGPLMLVSSGSAQCDMSFNAGIDFVDPADWNADGVVNTADFFAFIFDFQNGNADFNHSGDTNTADLFDFLQAFNR